MSFSFSARGADKAAVKEAIAAEMAKVVEQQSMHKFDADAVIAAASSSVDNLTDDDTKDICVSVSGSLSWEGDTSTPDDCKITSSSINTSAYFTARAAEGDGA